MTLRQLDKLSRSEWLLVMYKLARGLSLVQLRVSDIRKEALWN